MIKFVQLAIFALFAQCAVHGGSPDPGTEVRDKLYHALFDGYNIHTHATNASIKFGIAILDVDFDLERNLMITDAWERVVWNDTRLQWSKDDYNIDVIRIPSELVWKPDVTLYNGLQYKTEIFPTNVLIYPTGEVLWVPPVQYHSRCNLTMKNYPSKEQTCTLKFGSWTFDGYMMDLNFYNNKTEVDLSDYAGFKYKIKTNTAERHVKFYPCCPEPYLDLTYSVGITRRTEEEMTAACSGDIKEE